MAKWIENQKTGTTICLLDNVKTAYLVILLLEKEKVPRNCVDEVFKTVKDILSYQEVTHTARDERNPNFPK